MPEKRKTPDSDWRPFVQELGHRIAALRKQREWSQLDLANRSGMSLRSVQLIELGKRSWEGPNSKLANPTLDTLCVFAAALDVTPAELLAPLGAPVRGLSRRKHARLGLPGRDRSVEAQEL